MKKVKTNTKKYLKVLGISLIVIVILLGIGIKVHTKKVVTPVDDTLYIIDGNGILILCEDSDESYKELATQLKGNGDQLIKTIKELQKKEQNVRIKNAIGVGYLLLRRFDESKKYFDEALEMATTAEEKACILSNLVDYSFYQENNNEAMQYIKEASELETSDPVKQLVLKSNLLSAELNEENFSKIKSQVKRLLKEEKATIGSNQFIGIYNYSTLACVYYLENNMKDFQYYIDKALELNESIYQYKFVEANLYRVCANTYMFFDYDTTYDDKALKYENKCIKVLEEWQTKDHFDLLNAYLALGSIYQYNYQPNKAMETYELVIERCPSYYDLAAVSYYNMAFVYEDLLKNDKEIESYARAYYLLNLHGREKKNENIKENLRYLYKKEGKNKKDFDSWFQEKIKKAEEDLSDYTKSHSS